MFILNWELVIFIYGDTQKPLSSRDIAGGIKYISFPKSIYIHVIVHIFINYIYKITIFFQIIFFRKYVLYIVLYEFLFHLTFQPDHYYGNDDCCKQRTKLWKNNICY